MPFPRYPHQDHGLKLLREQQATMLAWEMGCGKSRVIVDHVAEERPHRTIIFAPTAVVPVWPREFVKHQPSAPLMVVPLVGTKQKRLKALANALSEQGQRGDMPLVVVVNYEAVRSTELAHALKCVDWQLAVCDEVHKIKSATGMQSKRVAAICGQGESSKRVGLTGTPLPHSPLDAFGQFRWLDPQVYGPSFVRFRGAYCIMGGMRVNGRPVQVLGYRNMEDFHERFYTVAHRVTKEEVLSDLPEQTHAYRLVALPSKARKVYKAMEDDLYAEVDSGEISADNALVKLVRLQQISSGYIVDDDDVKRELHDEKRKALEEVFSDIPQDKPVVVFCKFVHDLTAVKAAAEKSERAYMEQSGRSRDWEKFQFESESGEVIGVQIQSGGAGIDLTRSCHCVYMSNTHSLGDYDQSLARLHRPGQRHDVSYTHILAAGTVDEGIYESLQTRQNVVQRVLNGERLSEGITL